MCPTTASAGSDELSSCSYILKAAELCSSSPSLSTCIRSRSAGMGTSCSLQPGLSPCWSSGSLTILTASLVSHNVVHQILFCPALSSFGSTCI